MTHLSNTLLASAAARAFCASALCVVACACSAGSKADGVTVTPGSEVRQGQTGVTLSLERAAGGLSKPTHVDLGDLVAVIDPSSTDQRLVLTVTVPHGAITGGRALSVETPGGAITEDDVILVTPISASPTGKDSSAGTLNHPFRTLARALSVAGPNDTCALAAGTYNAKAGEAWGYVPPDSLTISGESTSTTVLEGPAAAAFMPAGTLTLQNLSFSGFGSAVTITETAQLNLQLVAVGGGGEGIVLGGAGTTVGLGGGSIDSTNYGIEVDSTCVDCSLSLNGTKLTQSADGPILQVSKLSQHTKLTLLSAVLKGGTFVADPTATLHIEDSQLTGNGANAALNFGGTQLYASGSTFTAGSGPYGINLESGLMTLDSDVVEGNQYGVYQLGGTSTVRNTKISGYSSIGFYFASGDLDLGTAMERGNNSFVADSDGAYGLYVDTNTTPLSCSNTSFDGVVPPTSVVLNSGTDLLQQAHQYVLTAGKTISFYNVP